MLSGPTFFTMKVVYSGLAADGSDLFVDDDVSGSAALEHRDRISALSFSTSHELAAVVQSFLELSRIPLLLETLCHDRGGFWGERLLERIVFSLARGGVGNSLKLASRNW